MDIATRRLPLAPLPWRTLGIVALILVLAAAAVLVGVGSRQQVPQPFGPARNGPLTYTQNDAIYARDTITAPERLLVGGDGTKNGLWGYSPDGTKILFQRTVTGFDYLMVADADGRNPRPILEPKLEDASVAWSPNGRTVAVATGARGIRKLLLVNVDGSPPVEIDLKGANPSAYGQLHATDLAWRPPDGAELLVRAEAFDRSVDFYRIRADGTVLGRLHLKDPMLFGSKWDVSGPTWSPSGDRIAYNQVEPIGVDSGAHFRVHIVLPDGTGDHAVPGPAEPNIQEAWPRWSPNGQWILAHRWTWNEDGDGRGWLAILPADGSAPGRDVGPFIPGGEDTGLIMAWSPDGTRILMRTTNTEEMFSIDPVGGDVEKITWSAMDLPDVRRMP